MYWLFGYISFFNLLCNISLVLLLHVLQIQIANTEKLTSFTCITDDCVQINFKCPTNIPYFNFVLKSPLIHLIIIFYLYQHYPIAVINDDYVHGHFVSWYHSRWHVFHINWFSSHSQKTYHNLNEWDKCSYWHLLSVVVSWNM